MQINPFRPLRHFVFSLVWLTAVTRLQAETPTAAALDFADLERTAVAELKASKTPGAAIAVIREGDVLWAKGLGLANVETGQTVAPEMLFRLGSTTKMFTAAALVGLAEEGKLKLDEPIGRTIPNLDPRIAALTAHQLLTHTAGLTDESIMNGRHDDAALAAGIRAMDASWLFTEPNAIHSYANPGYWIAGLACEQLAGKPYAEVMDERLFRPLGMQRTTLRPTLAMTWPLALGHEVRNGQEVIARPQADNAGTWPAGQMYSNVFELASFTTAFMNGGRLDGKQVLSPAVIAKLSLPYVPRPGTGDHYGYGLMISTDGGLKILQHGGSRTGYGSTIRMVPERKIAVIILTNRTGSSLPKTASRALEIALGQKLSSDPPAGQPQPLTEQEAANLVGIYTNHRQTIELFLRDGQLQARRSGDTSFSGAASSVLKSGDRRLVLTGLTTKDEPSHTQSTLIVVPGKDGKAEYLCSGSRALKKQPAMDAQGKQ